MEISITVEGFGLAWDRWKELIIKLEACGFAGIYKSDHFNFNFPPHTDHLEVYVALTYLASHIPRVHFGTLVSPVSYRDPVMLARQAMAMDDLSGGRMILGVGTGWEEPEHAMFGYTLGTVKERLDRFEEALAVMTQLIRSDDLVTFQGKYYQLQDAVLMPRPQRKTPIMIGGDGPKRTLPLVARYADVWNCRGSLEKFKERSALLDSLLLAEGRQPGDVKRTMLLLFGCWQTATERAQIVEDIPEASRNFFGRKDSLIEMLESTFPTASPDGVVEYLREFEEAGVEELVFHYFGVYGNTQLDILAEHVLPHFT